MRFFTLKRIIIDYGDRKEEVPAGTFGSFSYVVEEDGGIGISWDNGIVCEISPNNKNIICINTPDEESFWEGYCEGVNVGYENGREDGYKAIKEES